MKEKVVKVLKRIKLVIKMELEQFQDPYYQGVPAQLAFYLFLSVLPTMILLSQMLGIFSLSLEEIQLWARVNLTGEGLDVLNGLLEYRPSGANSIFMAVTALWAASKAQFSLLRITNYTLSDGQFIGKSYVKDRARSMMTIIVVMTTLVVALVALVYLPVVLELVFGKGMTTGLGSKLWLVIRWVLVAVLYFLMMLYIYYFMPSKRVSVKDILPGSIFSSIGFLGVNFFYSQYTKFSINNDILYGSMSNIVVLLFWFWLVAWVLCLGIALNRVWWATRSENAIPIPEEMKMRRKPINII